MGTSNRISEEKLISSIVVIKRIKKYIPISEYHKIYSALFKSHISYCISCWGGISQNKLQGLFSVQKRCIRLLFGKELNYDHSEYYETCARVRPYNQHVAERNFQLEHTKPLFNKMNLLTLHHLYIYHTFIDTFKIMKYRTPISMFQLLEETPSDINIRLLVPKVTLDMAKTNFVFQASCTWNELIPKLMNKCYPNSKGVIVPGSSKNSDLAMSISAIKEKLKGILLSTQKLCQLNNLHGKPKIHNEWTPENFFTTHYPA